LAVVSLAAVGLAVVGLAVVGLAVVGWAVVEWAPLAVVVVTFEWVVLLGEVGCTVECVLLREVDGASVTAPFTDGGESTITARTT
jgi:hypothetical protein